MISDTLSDAIYEINRYLNDPVFNKTYAPFKGELTELCDKMGATREHLDQAERHDA